MKHFIYSSSYTITDQQDTYFINIDRRMSHDEFQKYIINVFRLGEEYGSVSWDLFNDLLHGFYFTDKKNVVYYHSQLPDFEERDLAVYIELLLNAVNVWDVYPEWNFEVVFEENLKDKVELLIKNHSIIDEVKRLMQQHPR